MSAQQIDVLARIEAAWGKQSQEYAAVAELIEAASDYADVEENAYDCTQRIPARNRIRDAIARVGGAAELEAALHQSGESERRDAARYRWLRDNAGAWEVSRDVGEWTRTETGEKFKPRVYFTAYSTGYGGLTIDEAIDAAIATNDKRGAA